MLINGSVRCTVLAVTVDIVVCSTMVNHTHGEFVQYMLTGCKSTIECVQVFECV